LRKRGLFLCSNEIEVEHPYYNTPDGRKLWADIGKKEVFHGNATLWEDEGTGNVMVKATIPLPNKFESFMKHESERADKFLS